MPEIDTVIHAPARLRIMAALVSLEPRAQLDFRTLGTTSATSKGRARFEGHVAALREICGV